MRVFIHSSVEAFILKLDLQTKEKAHMLIDRLEKYGNQLLMPDAKPIGSGLWELRIRGHPAIRILYAFCGDQIILLLAFKKQLNAIKPRDLALAQERFKLFCPE